MITHGRRRCLAALGGLALGACNQAPMPPGTFRLVRGPAQVAASDDSSELVVATRAATSIYHVDPDGGVSGLEADLVRRFAEEQRKPARFVVLKSLAEVRWALYTRRAHFAAAGLIDNPHWRSDARFTGPYRRVTPEVVYSVHHHRKLDDIEELDGLQVAVIADSAHAEMLEDLRRRAHLDIKVVRVDAGIDPVDLLARVEAGEIPYAVADSQQVQLAQQYYPSLAVAFELGPPQRLCWAFPLGREDRLYRRASDFFVRISANGELTRLAERYYGHLGMLSYQDVAGLLERRLSVLPRFAALFKRAQLRTGLDWRLLAALAYQESKWDPHATSVTGVRGIMMLTGDTADELGVGDRLDPEQAIPAAARYLAQLIEAQPSRVVDPDRLWLGLAAYNVGWNHLEDARMLAQRQGLNPASWLDIKRMLPNLAHPEMFSELKAGYARGGEPVSFVDSVRGYFDILRRFEPEYQAPLASTLSATSPR
ncbi:MAG: membrane-bound lytic murein transglycosylase MltF [Pseudomonadota bacterium]|nr:membrane-bound lytic murein transglycosylase MltF [Pseudomonadota bacterium]